jgi:predicted MFS family arabinose efflux permease
MRQLWCSQVLSEAGDWAARVALAVLILDRSHSVALSALVTTASLLPSVGIGQWLATYGDRLSRRRLMVIADLSRAAVFALLVLPLPIWAILLLVFLAGCASAPFEAARAALMPSTVPAQLYPAALALATATYQLAIIMGTLLGGALLAAIGPRAAVAANCVSFLASAALVARLRVGSEPTSSDRTVRVRDGLRAVTRDPYVQRAMLTLTVLASCGVVTEALVPALVRRDLHRGGGTTGIAIATIAVGSLGVTAIVRIGGSPRRLLRQNALMACAGASIAAVGLATQLGWPGVLIPLAGVGAIFASGVPANAILGTRVPDDVRSSAYGIVNGVLQAATAAAAALGGLAAIHIGVRTTCVIANVAALVVGAVAFLYPVRGELLGDGGQIEPDRRGAE